MIIECEPHVILNILAVSVKDYLTQYIQTIIISTHSIKATREVFCTFRCEVFAAWTSCISDARES